METLTCVSERPIGELRARQIIGLLAIKISEMPDLTKKILALRYHKNLSINDIAVLLDLPVVIIQEIHSKAICSLREYHSTDDRFV